MRLHYMTFKFRGMERGMEKGGRRQQKRGKERGRGGLWDRIPLAGPPAGSLIYLLCFAGQPAG